MTLPGDSGTWLVTFSAAVSSSFDSAVLDCRRNGAAANTFSLSGLTVGDNALGHTERMNVSATMRATGAAGTTFGISCYHQIAVGTGGVVVSGATLSAIEVQ